MRTVIIKDKEYTINDFNLDSAIRAAKSIAEQQFGKGSREDYWEACNFEFAYEEFTRQYGHDSIYEVHEYYFSDLIEIEGEVLRERPI